MFHIMGLDHHGHGQYNAGRGPEAEDVNQIAFRVVQEVIRLREEAHPQKAVPCPMPGIAFREGSDTGEE